MLAVDTNVVVRYLAADHPDQSERARVLMTGQEVWVPTTVLLEAEWVLRRAYRFGPAEIGNAFRQLAGMPMVAVEDPELLFHALEVFAAGMDMADALHYASASAREGCQGFATFDEALIRSAASAGTLPVVRP